MVCLQFKNNGGGFARLFGPCTLGRTWGTGPSFKLSLLPYRSSMRIAFVLASTLFLVSGVCSAQSWQLQQSGTAAGLRGIHAVDGKVVWASGTEGTVLRSLDGGAQWQRCATPPSAEKLDFRGIWAWDARTAFALSSGPGDLSRLYRTTDGCTTWKLIFTNPDAGGFWPPR